MNIASSIVRVIPRQTGLLTCGETWEVRETASCLFHRMKYIYGGTAFYESETTKAMGLKHGHLYLFPSNKPYHLFHDTRDRIHCLWFHITLDPDITNEYIEFPIQNGSIAFHLIQVLEKLVGSGSASVDSLSALVKELLVSCAPTAGFSFINDARVLKAVNAIHDNYAASLSLERLAGIVGVNKYYFVRLFRTAVGVAPMQYLLQYRIRCAKEMLNQDLPVKEVAKNTGFNDEKFFSKIFKKYESVSPRDFKKLRMNAP
ncbi:MAG: AraC family transcriptional regulator [Spirochaetota bacterium]